MLATARTLSTAALLGLAGLAVPACVAEEPRLPPTAPTPNEDEPGGGCEPSKTKELSTPITLRNAADFDKLPKGCWDLFAKLRIEGQAITSVAALGKLKGVNDLEIVDTGLTALDSEYPFQVYGTVVVSGNSKLTNLDKLQIDNADNLTAAYTVRNNAALTSIGGLAYIKGVEGDLRIAENPKLATIRFDELEIANTIAIVNNGATALDLGSLVDVRRVEIASNAQLTTITGGSGAKVGGDFIVRGNRALVSLGSWSSLQQVLGSLTIDDNDALTSLGAFGSMQYVTSSVTITNNAVLANIDAISHLQGIGQTVSVTGNANLDNCLAREIDICVSSGPVTFNNNKPNTGTNCGLAWCQ